MDPGARDPQAELTETIESLFLSHRLTLTNPGTAEVFRVTVDAVQHMLAGAHASGAISQEQYDMLYGMTDGLRAVPDGLSPNA